MMAVPCASVNMKRLKDGNIELCRLFLVINKLPFYLFFFPIIIIIIIIIIITIMIKTLFNIGSTNIKYD